MQRLLAPLAVTRRVDDDRLALVAVMEGRAPRQVLQRVDRLPVAADQAAHLVGPVDGRADLLGGLLHLDRGVQLQRLDDAAHDLADPLDRLLRDLGHRRRPERFFFLRGPGGGAFASAPFELPSTFGLAFCAFFPSVAGFSAAGLPRAGLSVRAAAPARAGAGSTCTKRFIASCWP